MEKPVLISWCCYGCFEPVYSWLGKAAPCRNCEPTVYEDDDAYTYETQQYGYWVNATGIEVTSRSDQVEQDAVWEEYDFRMNLLEEDWEEVMQDAFTARAPWPYNLGRRRLPGVFWCPDLGGNMGPWIPTPEQVAQFDRDWAIAQMCDIFGVPKEVIYA